MYNKATTFFNTKITEKILHKPSVNQRPIFTPFQHTYACIQAMRSKYGAHPSPPNKKEFHE